MDVDAFVLAHRPTWNRLEELVKRRKRLTGAEVDELVELYQRVSTHLSMVRTASSDSVLVGRLSSLVAQARSAVTSAHAPLWSQFIRFWTVSFPVVAYRAWRWWLATAVAFFVVTIVIAMWVAGNPEVQATLGTPSEIDQLVNHEFADYYSEHPAGSFALQVWTNNFWVAGQCIGFALLLGIPIPYVLFQNAANLGLIAGLMFNAGKGDIMLGLLAPHGLIELTAVFLAGAVGHAAWLDGDLTGQPAPRPSAGRAGQGSRVRGGRTGGRAVGRRTDRGLRYAIAVADLRADRYRRARRSRLPGLRDSLRPQGRRGRGRPATWTTRRTSCRRADA